MEKVVRNKCVKEYDVLIKSIENMVERAKNKIAKSINNTMVETYWNIGRYIVEYEQGGVFKAEYGTTLIRRISKDLTLRLGKGFGTVNLSNMRKFYQYYRNFQTVSEKLSWSHICELLSIDNELERKFYENEIIKENWSVRMLRRQKETALFLKIASTKSKDEIILLAENGINQSKIEDVIKDTYTLEFLNLQENKKYTETELETKIIDNLEKFLLELGKGFTFVGRQYRILIDNTYYYADLVFYHRILKCFVIIDLKVDKVKHEDIRTDEYVYGIFCTRRKFFG